MKYAILDLEADGLLGEASVIHCICMAIYEDKILLEEVDLIDYPSMFKGLDRLVEEKIILVGHNVKRYDIPVLKEVLGYVYTGQVIDTLALSWYLYPNEPEHGLEIWGQRIGVKKPEISNWVGLSIQEYVHRCTQDVIINTIIFGDFLAYLQDIYADKDIFPIMMYLTWKLDCAAEQEANPLTIDREYCTATLNEITPLIEDKKNTLSSAMPPVIKYSIKSKPAKMFTVKGELTKAGEAWLELLADNDLEADFTGEISIIKGKEPPNPTSTVQLKAWLFSLGWQPTLFDYKKNTAGEVKAIPQLQDKNTKKLCPNIQWLATENPALDALKGLFMLQHRIGVLKGFLEMSDENGKMKAEIAGFTNTLRFRHKKPIANLPGVDKPYGRQIRGAIIAPDEEHSFCGSDMTSLEDSTKQHYMFFYDPEYVTQMRVPGFDPHLDIALLSHIMSEEEVNLFKTLDKKSDMTPQEVLEYAQLKKKRSKAKIVNFSGIYGAGPPKIALTTGMSLQEATLLHTIYWSRNKSVKQIANDCVTKVVRKQMWLYNPVSKFWYSLRQPKDKFSTLNQGKLCSE